MKLLLSDIDGTLLPWGHHVVSQHTRTVLHRALDAGLIVGPASGRGYAWIRRIFDHDDACYATALATNGMQIYYQGKQLYEKKLPLEALEHICTISASFPHTGLLCFDGSEPLLVAGEARDVARSFPDYASCHAASVGALQRVIKASVFCGAGPDDHRAYVEELRREIPELDIDFSRPTFSNVMPAGWNKGTAVTYLQTYLGIDPYDVFVFGDADNDIPMFQAVENSVAVSTATPQAAAAARWHIGSADEEAVPAALECFIAGKFPFTT